MAQNPSPVTTAKAPSPFSYFSGLQQSGHSVPSVLGDSALGRLLWGWRRDEVKHPATRAKQEAQGSGGLSLNEATNFP